jgi:hypothetical protein
MKSFENDLRQLLNEYSQENGSDTPDFILARYLNDCLTAWNHGMAARRRWYGDVKVPTSSHERFEIRPGEDPVEAGRRLYREITEGK